MKERTIISIIIPVYNAENFLHQCIDSILKQTYTDFELLLVDDGSSDGSRAICEEYAASEKRIRVFHKENGGVSSARNVGLAAATGQWITFVDADDVIPEDSLSNLVSSAEMEDVQLVVTGYELFNDEGTYYSTRSIDSPDYALPFEDALKQMYHNGYWPWFMCSKLFSKTVIDKHRLRFDEGIKYCEYKLFITQFLCSMNGRTYFSSIPTYRYRNHDQSAEASTRSIYNDDKVTGFVSSVKAYQALTDTCCSAKNRKSALNDFINSYRIHNNALRRSGMSKSIYKSKIDELFFSKVSRLKYIVFLAARKIATILHLEW